MYLAGSRPCSCRRRQSGSPTTKFVYLLNGYLVRPYSQINSQIYADWWYAWTLTYLMGTHRDVFIVLKKSLKWVPILGWVSTAAPPPADRADSGRMYAQGMQFFNFIFLARSWASDRLDLSRSLSWLARCAEKEDSPLTFILYPEGTLVSKDTRPVSKKYADKLGIVRKATRCMRPCSHCYSV